MIRSGVTYRSLSGHMGSPWRVIDPTTGEVVRRSDYDARQRSRGARPQVATGGAVDRERMWGLLSLGVGIIATLATSCVSADDGAFRDWKGRVVVSTPAEIAQTQAIVRAARSAEDLPKGSEGMIVADGVVEDVRQKPGGRAIATFKVERVISGDLCVGQTIAIQTSSIDKGVSGSRRSRGTA
jgi:hypothetical protein